MSVERGPMIGRHSTCTCLFAAIASLQLAIAAITATQPLTQLFRINLSIKEQKLGAELSQQSYSQHERDVVNEVRRAYYAILQSQSELESQRAVLAYLDG